MQHLITDTLAACLNRKSKQKLGEYDLRQCEKLRQVILDDFGNPSFKERVLDMIAKLERDSNEMVAAGDSSLAKRQAEAVVTSAHQQRPPGKATLQVKGRPMADEDVVPRGNTTMMTGSQMVGDGDEDSEGIENVREEMFTYSQDLVKDLERKMTKHVSQEVDRVLGVLGKYREVVEKRMGDLHTFLDELKDEIDRLGERLKS